MKHILRTLALPTALAATLVLASCGTNNDGHGTAGMNGSTGMNGTATGAPAAGGAPATGAKNKADVEFATMMIPHHAQAVAMAAMAPNQGTDPKVKALAAKIKEAQAPEIARMSGWLTGWGAPVPDTSGGSGMSGMGGQAGGMMSAQEMTDLGKATGSGFDRMWLQSMTKHHEGAVDMAKTELAKGTNPDAKKLAQSIIDSQSSEIAEMKSILAGIPG